MRPSVTQEKSLAIVALAERLGWTVSKFETTGKTLFRGSPRFVLVLQREKNDFLLGQPQRYLSLPQGLPKGGSSGVVQSPERPVPRVDLPDFVPRGVCRRGPSESSGRALAFFGDGPGGGGCARLRTKTG